MEVEIQSSRHETRISSTRVLYPLDHTISTRPEFQGGDGNKDEEMLKKVKMGKNAKECFAEMVKIERCKMDWGVR